MNKVNRYFTGVGSREIPTEMFDIMSEISLKLCKKGYILRSGAAEGADSAFERGCNMVNGEKEIYLPWRGFNDSTSGFFYISEEAMVLASQIHPAWHKLKQGAKKLHARNCYQVLGPNLRNPTPSEFVICWTKGGLEVGGTRTAIVLAKNNNIPVYNLFNKSDLETVYKILSEKI